MLVSNEYKKIALSIVINHQVGLSMKIDYHCSWHLMVKVVLVREHLPPSYLDLNKTKTFPRAEEILNHQLDKPC